jgi:hypothetical protein
LIGLPFGFSLLLLAAPMLLVFFLGFWTQNYLVLDRSFSHSLEKPKTAPYFI